MAKYIGTYENQAAVEAALAAATLSRPFVAYTTGDTKQVFYGTAADLAEIGDIIVYKVADGSIRFIHQDDYNTTDYPTADYEPIGIAAENQFIGLTSSKLNIAIMALNWLDPNNPDSGTTSPQTIRWGDGSFDIPELTNYDNLDDAITDMDGKLNTAKVLVYATGQPDWQTAATITFTDNQRMYPLFECAWRYHTNGTVQGDWYVPTCGQVSNLISDTDKKAKVQAAYTKLGKNASWGNSRVGSSTEATTGGAYYWAGSRWFSANKYDTFYNSVAFCNFTPLAV